MPFRTSSPICRRCRENLGDEGGAWRCATCGGRWLEEAELRNRYHQAGGRDMAELLVHEEGTVKIACPVCAEEMEHVFLDLLQMDRCLAHGVWLDEGELERVLAHAKTTPGKLLSPDKLGFTGLRPPPAKKT